MKGFAPKYSDFPDYILKITREIWEDRGIAALSHHYSPDIPMRFPEGLSIGNQNTMNSTLATLAQFSDRELTGEDVIWSGNEEDGFLSSHRILTMGTHTGDGYFGPATGKRFIIRAIADCAAINDQINDEWLIRDTGGLVKQLGMRPKKFERLHDRALQERDAPIRQDRREKRDDLRVCGVFIRPYVIHRVVCAARCPIYIFKKRV
mgnify:CR=1 FL=1